MTKSVRLFRSGHASGGRREGEQTGYEVIAQFHVPPESKGLRIKVDYRMGRDDEGGFFACFGRPFKDTGLTRESFESNALEFLLP